MATLALQEAAVAMSVAEAVGIFSTEFLDE